MVSNLYFQIDNPFWKKRGYTSLIPSGGNYDERGR